MNCGVDRWISCRTHPVSLTIVLNWRGRKTSDNGGSFALSVSITCGAVQPIKLPVKCTLGPWFMTVLDRALVTSVELSIYRVDINEYIGLTSMNI